ncbi:MFS family permease [Lipingzhangella halophila]|uniref:MFS family permease n=1 Tax=Lipingzhangella halophila TaxID=1783352 RepID=A0A7W7W1M2_9ACTN|nr:MFS transporter [Lipingzhangella halophila]MBB4930463.1 MFS family permease [Lipingzhangella halophila]
MTKTVARRRRAMGVAPLEGITGKEAAPFGWAPLIVLFLVGITDRIETSITSGALPLLQAEWGFSDTMGGMISTAPLIVGALMAIPAGVLADRFNRTALIALVVAIWSFITLGSALAPVFALFFLSRVLLGAADTIDNPASSSLLADYYPPKTRAKVFGWVRLTQYAGLAIGTIFGGVVGQAFGWRWAYACMVIPGLIVAYLCWRLREPVRGYLDEVLARDSDKPVPVPETDGRGTAVGSERPARIGTQLRYIWRIRTLRYVCGGLMCLSLGLQGILYWVPSLLNREFGLDPAEASLLSSMVGLLGVCAGAVFGGWLGGKLHGRVRGGRLLASAIGLLVGSLMLGIALSMDGLGMFIVFLGMSNFLTAIGIPNFFASMADVVQASSRGMSFAVLNFLVIGGSLGPVVVGAVSDANNGNLMLGMAALFPALLVAGLLVLLGRMHFDREAESVLAAAKPEPPAGEGTPAPD